MGQNLVLGSRDLPLGIAEQPATYHVRTVVKPADIAGDSQTGQDQEHFHPCQPAASYIPVANFMVGQMVRLTGMESSGIASRLGYVENQSGTRFGVLGVPTTGKPERCDTRSSYLDFPNALRRSIRSDTASLQQAKGLVYMPCRRILALLVRRTIRRRG